MIRVNEEGKAYMEKEKGTYKIKSFWKRKKVYGKGKGCMEKKKGAWKRKRVYGKGKGCMEKKKGT